MSVSETAQPVQTNAVSINNHKQQLVAATLCLLPILSTYQLCVPDSCILTRSTRGAGPELVASTCNNVCKPTNLEYGHSAKCHAHLTFVV